MSTVALPLTPDERIKLYDHVILDDKLYTRLGVPAPSTSRVMLVTKILLIGEVIRVETCYDPMRNQPAEYMWLSPEDLIVIVGI